MYLLDLSDEVLICVQLRLKGLVLLEFLHLLLEVAEVLEGGAAVREELVLLLNPGLGLKEGRGRDEELSRASQGPFSVIQDYAVARSSADTCFCLYVTSFKLISVSITLVHFL